jgi:Rieske Fe-S protein
LDRPYGYVRLGKISDLARAETYLEKDALLLRMDAGGFYIMSTECTYDLSNLKPERQANGEAVWVSSYTSSKYDSQGRVISGPARENLPYYLLEANNSVVGGPVDTLYARIGYKKSPDWRLKVN